MESKRTATTYFIPPGKFLLLENALGNPDLIQSSVSSDCRVTIVDRENFPLDELEQWPTFRLTSADIKLKLGDGLYHIYIAVPSTDNADTSTAFVSYSAKPVDLDGYEVIHSVDEEGNPTTQKGALLGKSGFKYYSFGTVSARGENPSAITVPAGQGRYIVVDLGVNPQDSYLDKKVDWSYLDKMFRPHYDDPLNPDTLTWIEAKAHMGVAGGLTSFIDNGSFKLPSIYDGLPIDNQTLYWEEVTEEVGTDEEGNPIYETTRVLKAAGGGGGAGGGSVQHRLYWEGFSSGSWDGSVAMTIMLPEKLSDLDGDVIVFKEDGWGDAFRIKPYFTGAGDDNYLAIERSVGGSGEEPSFNDCVKIHGMSGLIELLARGSEAISVTHDHEGTAWTSGFKVLNPHMYEGCHETIDFGKDSSSYNSGYISFKYTNLGSPDNCVSIGLYSRDDILTVNGYGQVILRGEEGGDMAFVFNPNGSITNVQGGGENIAIRHALRFKWYDDSYEIGAVRGGGREARGFGVTYGNHTLIFEVGEKFCDFHTPVNMRQGLYVQGDTTFVDYVKFDKPTTFVGNAGMNNISFVYNEDGVITNKTYDAESIRYALRFQWFKDAYEIGAVRTGWDEAFGFGVTYNNNKLVLKVNKTQMDVYEDLKVHGDIRLYDGDNPSKYKIVFGDGDPGNVYLYEDSGYFLNIYADGGMKLYTQSSKYIEMAGMGIKVNNGVITYNESGRYFELDGNLLVTGGITAFADSGAGNQWILDATSLSSVTSTNQYKVYSARVTKLIKDEVDDINDKITYIKTAFNGLSDSSSAAAIVSALKTLAGKL